MGARVMRSCNPFALSGSVWSSYRKSCVDMVMKWLVPESSGRYVNRMTNEALHKGRPCPSDRRTGGYLSARQAWRRH